MIPGLLHAIGLGDLGVEIRIWAGKEKIWNPAATFSSAGGEKG